MGLGVTQLDLILCLTEHGSGSGSTLNCVNPKPVDQIIGYFCLTHTKLKKGFVWYSRGGVGLTCGRH